MNQRLILISILFVGFIVFIVATFFYFLFKSHSKWKSQLKTSPIDRMLNTKDGFITFYLRKGYSVESIRFVYEHTQVFIKARDVILLPNDDLIKLYERQEDEWLYIIPKWFEKQGWQKPGIDKLKESLQKYKQVNFEYLIELLDKQKGQSK